VTLVSHMDVYGHVFRQQMDELNYMMKDKKYPKNLKRQCRMYLLHSRQLKRQVNYPKMEKHMSIDLRYAVAAANNKWVLHIWYFKEVSPSFVFDLSQNSHSLVYAPREIVEQAVTLCVVNKGIAARKGRIMPKWSVWGHDFMCDYPNLVDRAQTVALSYLEVVGICRDKMIKLLEDPDREKEHMLMRQATIFYTFRAALLKWARDTTQRRHSDDENTAAFATATMTKQKVSAAMQKADRRASNAVAQRRPSLEIYTTAASLGDTTEASDDEDKSICPESDLRRLTTKLTDVEKSLSHHQARVARLEKDLSMQMKNLALSVQTAMKHLTQQTNTSSNNLLLRPGTTPPQADS